MRGSSILVSQTTDVLVDVTAPTLAAITVSLAACGGGATPTSNASSLPGQGKPTIMLGDTSSSENVLLGELYAQAFRAKGFLVDLEPNLGDSQQIDTLFQSGQINAYPEYLGEVAATDAAYTQPITAEAQVEQIATQYEHGHGATVMLPVTPFSNSNEVIALKSYAQQKNLTTIADLKRLVTVKLAANPAAQTPGNFYRGSRNDCVRPAVS